jgi:hypothetical protein
MEGSYHKPVLQLPRGIEENPETLEYLVSGLRFEPRTFHIQRRNSKHSGMMFGFIVLFLW